MATTTSQTDTLVSLLHEAARLEHCLLDSYLFAACSLKTLPAEFATIPGRGENRRRAIQFERVRAWKQAILDVAREEMLHLHYVQCLIRALGAEPYFGLPGRDPQTGNWLFSDWRQHEGPAPAPGATEIPVQTLSPAMIRRFVSYESPDSLQDAGPLSKRAMDLFNRLHAFELDLQMESVVYDVTDPDERAALKAKLAALYNDLTPAEPGEEPVQALAVAGPSDGVEVRFQSIADLYNRSILPLYQEAFHYGWVTHTDRDLEGEQQDPSFAGEGFLPVEPIYRDKNYEKSAKGHLTTPLSRYKRVEDVVAEIVEEGEGQQAFERGAEALLAAVAEHRGARGYLEAQKADADPENMAPTPRWLADGQAIRRSHLYRFAMAMVELDQEIELARGAGVEFHPARSPLDPASHYELGVLCDSLPAQFNSAYAALLVWLTRMYEIRTWDSDRRRRMGIEMLAAWPLMSLAIRPLLELASFVPVDRRALFRAEPDAVPQAPPHARQLLALYAAPERSQPINDRMDYYALHALEDVAAWAAEQRDALAAVDDIEPHLYQAVIDRLDLLSTLGEFRRQFPFREHGGYSDRAPDQTFLMKYPDADHYEENGTYDPLQGKNPVFRSTFVLRVRFAGRQLVQLATDPDPPLDEVGCQGTHMFHAADGDDRRFDRALVWQPDLAPQANVIIRGPHDKLPPLGVRVQALDILVAGPEGAQSGYAAIGSASSAGAVEAQGLQSQPYVTGLDGITTIDSAGLRVSLLPKDGRMPFLNGYNHLVSRDGEPIDPFILALLSPDGSPITQREIFNDGRTILEMSPLQRLYTQRWPTGFAPSLAPVPDWALAMLSPQEQSAPTDPQFPQSYLDARAAMLGHALKESLGTPRWDRAAVDEVISFAERLRLVVNPSDTTVGWLPLVFFYGHTVSGAMVKPQPGTVPGLRDNEAGLQFDFAPAGRDTPNGRWFVTYNQGFMDTDALSALIYGELFIPLEVTSAGAPVSSTYRWQFASGLQDAAAAYGTRFDAPFWAKFHVDGNVRTVTLPDGTTITETLTVATETSYEYTATGVKGIGDYTGSFAVTDDAGTPTLTWTTRFTPATTDSSVYMFAVISGAASAMTAALDAHFSPAGGLP